MKTLSHLMRSMALAGPFVWGILGCGGVFSKTEPPHPAAARISAEQSVAYQPALESLPERGAPQSPLGLSASDGTGLRLVNLRVRAFVDEPIAFTEIRMVYENPLDRILEGTFQMTLPEGASISRFAMKIGDVWQEAEIVERVRAREAYEDFLHQRQDPALLEQAAGNAFGARVFPIPARGRKELVLSYSQELKGNYVIPLRGLPEIGEVDVLVSSTGTDIPLGELHQQHMLPNADFVVKPPNTERASAGLRGGDVVVARVSPIQTSVPDPITNALILVDTSASRALGFAEELRGLGQLIHSLALRAGEQMPLMVACFDQVVEPMFMGEAGAFGEHELRRIYARGALGASDLGAALDWASEQAKRAGIKRIILVGDGVATAGFLEANELRAKAAAISKAGVERVDAVFVGGIHDTAVLHQITAAGLAHDGIVADGTLSAEELGRRLNEGTHPELTVQVPHARWTWPSVLSGIQAGDSVLVYAEIPESKPFSVIIGGRELPPLSLGKTENALLERAWAKAKIDSLLFQQAQGTTKDPSQLEREMIGLSTSHRVLSPYTSLLVLETESDYERFRIERRALADILTVDGGKLQVMKRTLPGTQAPPPAAPSGESNGTPTSGGLNQLSSRQDLPSRAGANTAASRSGTLTPGVSARGRYVLRERRVKPPAIRMGSVTVSGRLPPETIQGIIRRNFGRFRKCYEEGLRASPNLSGRVSVRFTIEPSGAVGSAAVTDSAFVDTKVSDCVAEAFRGLSFPAPEGGTITVIYPILFSPSAPERAGTNGGTPGSSRPEEPPVRFSEINRHRFQVPRSSPVEREMPPESTPLEGRYRTVMEALSHGRTGEAFREAQAWVRATPGDVLALTALGESFEAMGDTMGAARAYGSLIDLFPARADLRRFAGARLESIRGNAGLALAVDTYAKAAQDRPDHPSSHRLSGFALLKKGDYQGAFEAVEAGLSRTYPWGRFEGAKTILAEDLGLIAAAWLKAEPARHEEIMDRLYAARGVMEDRPSIRFVLNWETDANDVDFHIYDEEGGHAYFGQRNLGVGGMLYADVRNGYGPECFTIRLPREERSKAYTLVLNYYSRGPMGYGMGKVQIIDHDGKGGLRFEERPFVATSDQAYVNLGKVLK